MKRILLSLIAVFFLTNQSLAAICVEQAHCGQAVEQSQERDCHQQKMQTAAAESECPACALDICTGNETILHRSGGFEAVDHHVELLPRISSLAESLALPSAPAKALPDRISQTIVLPKLKNWQAWFSVFRN